MEKKKEKSNRKRRKPRQDTSPDSDSDCSPPSSPTSLRRLLDPYSKPRLLALLSDAAAGAGADDPTLLAHIRAAADASPSHRRLFVHGLPPHADSPALAAAFSRFGPLAECDVVARRATGVCKGFGFVTFQSRAAARRALRAVGVGGVVVAGRAVSAQFATAGVDASSGAAAAAAGRRVYVTNVAPGASAERLRAFFAGFGELEGGPFGFDADTGSSRGCALFVYRAAVGAMRALEEPYRVFEGRTLHCQLAADPARKSKPRTTPQPPAPAAVAPPLPALQPVLDAVVASGVGDLAMYAQNPAQAAALLGKNPILAAAVLNSALASATTALKPNPAAASSINPAAVVARSSPVAAPAVKPLLVAPQSPAVVGAAVVPSPVKIGAGISGGAGLLGPYKQPSSPVLASSVGQRDRC